MRYKKQLAAIMIFSAEAVVGAAAGVLIQAYFRAAPPKEVHEGQVAFINPLLECEDGGILSGRELASFLPAMRKLVASEIAAGNARSIAVYFRDLNNGPWFGIDEDEYFIPASLLKVPMMMAYFMRAEADPSVLMKKITFSEKQENAKQNIRPIDSLVRGRAYTVEELIERMIIHSDNDAADLLLVHDRDDHFGKVFHDLGLVPPGKNAPEYYLTIKDYASFFRVLYNGSYLSKEMSNRALHLLTQSYFRGGLVGGVPRDTPVAHKFGERRVKGQPQFHDCGIVYYPDHPYLLCVMSRGAELANLVSTVQKVSEQVFLDVDRQVRSQGR